VAPLTRLLCLVFVFTTPWEGVIRIPGIGTIATAVGIAAAALWATTVSVSGRVRRPGPFVVAVAAFVAWNGASVLWSADPGRSLAHVYTWAQSFVLVLILWDLFRSRADVLAALQAYVLGAYVAVGGALVNLRSGDPFYTHYQRFSPGDVNPDGFGFVVALGIPVACYLAGARVGRGRALRWINLGYVPAAFLGIALSGTRTAAVGAVVGLAFGLAALTRLRLSARVVALVVLATAVYLLLPVVQPLRSFERLGTTGSELTRGDLNGRLEQWRQGLVAFAEHPVAGVGTNMYRSVNTLGKVGHNSFLSVLVEVGLVGGILFGGILAIAVAHALARERWDRGFWLTVLGVWAIGASTLTWEYRKTTWVFLTLLVVDAVAAARQGSAALEEVPEEDEEEALPAIA